MQEQFWKTKEGKYIKVGDMSESHAKNALRMLIKKFHAEKETIEENNPDDAGYNAWSDGYPGDFGYR